MIKLFGYVLRSEQEEEALATSLMADCLREKRQWEDKFFQAAQDMNNLNHQLAEFDRLVASKNAQIVAITEELETFKKQASKDNKTSIYEQYWNNRRPEAKIKYVGRLRPTDKTAYAIDVRNFIQPYDYEITDDLANNKLTEPTSLQEMSLQIYKHHQKKWLNYALDQQSVGVPEYWMFPSEMRELISSGRGGDCDDYSNSLASYLVAAGLPYWRVRVAAGMTYSGIGHATVYVLSDDYKVWRHFNSTAPASSIPNSFDELPQSGNSSDLMGIQHYWFSYNQQHAFSVFESSVAEDSFPKEKFEVSK